MEAKGIKGIVFAVITAVCLLLVIFIVAPQQQRVELPEIPDNTCSAQMGEDKTCYK